MPRLMRSLRARMASDDGVTLVELMVGSALSLLVLTTASIFLISAMRANVFTEGESTTMNNTRNAMQQIDKEVRGADSISFCAPAGSCVIVGAQTPLSTFRTVRYTKSGTDLRREIFDTASGTWGAPTTIISRVSNTGSQPVFACDTQSSLLRVNVDLYIEPTPHSSPFYNMQTSIRPRNYPSKATCP